MNRNMTVKGEGTDRGTILLVDDTPDTITMLRSILETEGYLVLIATNGEKGLQRAKSGRPDLILLDILMPGTDGFETCIQLKKDPDTRDIPIIFLSGQTDTFDKVKAFEIGGVDYLEKPVATKELIARINTHLSISTLRKELTEANTRLEDRVNERTQELSRAYDSLAAKERELRQKYDDLKHKDWELMLSRHRNTTLVRAIPDIMFVCTVDGNFLDYHLPEGIGSLISSDEVTGKTIEELGFNAETTALFIHHIRSAAESRSLQKFTYELETPEGIRYGDARILALNASEVLGIIRDITQEHLFEQAKVEAFSKIERIMEQLQIYNDHIRNPLTILSCLMDNHGFEKKEEVLHQIEEIDAIIDQVDIGFIESEKVRRYMKKHYFD